MKTKIVNGSQLKVGDFVIAYGQTRDSVTSKWWAWENGFTIGTITDTGFSGAMTNTAFSAPPKLWYFKIKDESPAPELQGEYSL